MPAETLPNIEDPVIGRVKIIERPQQRLDPVTFDESEMGKCWGAFGEGFIYQPHIDSEGNLISVNILAGTLGFPVGTRDLLPDILTRAQAKRVEGRIAPLFGYNEEDTLMYSRQGTNQNQANDDTMNIYLELMDAAEEVIRERHPYQQHHSVQTFYEDNKKRREVIIQHKLKKEGLATLSDPNSEMYNAWEHDIEGFYFMSWKILPDGITPGIDPNGKEGFVDACIARPGFGHDRWLGHHAQLSRELVNGIQDKLAAWRIAKANGLSYPDLGSLTTVTLGWHADGTLDVSNCDVVARGNTTSLGGCSSFFDIQTAKRNSIAVSGSSVSFTNSSSNAEVNYYHNQCDKCGQNVAADNSEHNCKKES